MPLAFDSIAWSSVAAALAAAPAAMLTVALAAVGEIVCDEGGPMRRPLRESNGLRVLRRQRYWHASALAVVLATLLAAALGASTAVTGGAAIGAMFGAWLMRGCALARRPCAVALAGSGMGVAVMSAGIARYLSTAATATVAVARPNAERIELYAVVFIGAMIFATSAIAFCRLRGSLRIDTATRTGDGIVDLGAMLLCAWLGYGFVTEQAAPFGLAALLAMSALACGLGVHLMIHRAPSRAFDTGVFSARCEGAVLIDRRGLLARLVWDDGDDGDEPAWTLSETAPRALRTSAYRHRRAENKRAQRYADDCAHSATRRRVGASYRACWSACSRPKQLTGRDRR